MRLASRGSGSSIHGNHPCLHSTFHRGIFTEFHGELHVNITDCKDELFVPSNVRCGHEVVTHGLYSTNEIKPSEIRLHEPPPR